jgi:hypothetical protein
MRDSIYEFAVLLNVELRKRLCTIRESSIVQMLDWLADLITLSAHPEKGIQYISLMTKSDDSDTADYI